MAVAKRLYFDLPGFGRVHAINGRLKLAGDKREMQTSDAGPAGPSAEYMTGELSFSIRNQPGMSLVALGDLNGVDVFVQDDLGKSWLCRGAFTTERPELSGGEISMAMQFEDQEELI